MHRPFIPTWIDRQCSRSTNDLARRLAVRGGRPLPMLVRAHRQTRGRGRGDHLWWSDAGGLTFTLVLDPAAHGLRIEHEPRLALAAAVAIIDALSPLAGLGIRWPNDIEIGGRKLGGILPERWETPQGTRIALGIGLNVRTKLSDAPAEVRRMAVSLADLVAGPPELDAVLGAVLGRFEDVLNRLASDDPMLAERWDQLDALRNHWVRINTGPRLESGLGQGIGSDGALLLATDRGLVRLFGGQVLREG